MFCAPILLIRFSLLFLYIYILLSRNDSDLSYLQFYQYVSGLVETYVEGSTLLLKGYLTCAGTVHVVVLLHVS